MIALEIIKWVVFLAVIGLTTWLLVDTIIMVVKKVKAKKKAKLEKQQKDSNSQSE